MIVRRSRECFPSGRTPNSSPASSAFGSTFFIYSSTHLGVKGLILFYHVSSCIGVFALIAFLFRRHRWLHYYFLWFPVRRILSLSLISSFGSVVVYLFIPFIFYILLQGWHYYSILSILCILELITSYSFSVFCYRYSTSTNQTCLDRILLSIYVRCSNDFYVSILF